ncbi:MAG: SDR family NAD(P)-dependent oxidoreductase [Nostoc sp.]|uniref:SDR family NAD(P)-dependent oxidoreductase n=1 Tax=Nostoc sp. TaxID=1180 RepID=UPI002FF4B5DA
MMNNNKVAIVTGASRGIEQATAIRLAQDGFAVVVHYAGNAEKAEKTVAEIESKGGHWLPIECPERLASDLISFFNK